MINCVNFLQCVFSNLKFSVLPTRAGSVAFRGNDSLDTVGDVMFLVTSIQFKVTSKKVRKQTLFLQILMIMHTISHTACKKMM